MSTVRVSLALTALALGALAAIAASPLPPLADDEIAAVDLALRLRDRRAGLLVVDARSAHAMAQDRLPGARLLAEVDAAILGEADTVVVYADRDVDARTVDTLRRSPGTRRYLRLHGGIEAWNDDVRYPVVRSDASAAQQQRFELRAQLSRYFGGTPRRLDPGAANGRPRSRQGC